jgi:hypothetical protein
VENRYAALVRGSSAIFPRGYLWLIPAWYVVMAIAMEIKGQMPNWYCDCALGALLLATFTLIAVLSTLRSNAFLADDSGIWLGLRAGARRRFGPRRRQSRHLPWPEVLQIKIASRRYGARLEVFLPAQALTGRGRFIWRIIAAIVTLLIPVAYLFRAPGLVRPRSGPLRYRIPLYEVTPEQLRLALAPLAPPNVTIAVLPRWRTRVMRRLRGTRRSRLATAA